MNSLAYAILSVSASPELSLLAKATLFLLLGLAAGNRGNTYVEVF